MSADEATNKSGTEVEDPTLVTFVTDANAVGELCDAIDARKLMHIHEAGCNPLLRAISAGNTMVSLIADEMDEVLSKLSGDIRGEALDFRPMSAAMIDSATTVLASLGIPSRLLFLTPNIGRVRDMNPEDKTDGFCLNTLVGLTSLAGGIGEAQMAISVAHARTPETQEEFVEFMLERLHPLVAVSAHLARKYNDQTLEATMATVLAVAVSGSAKAGVTVH